MVKIKHKYGFTTLYGHLYYIKVRAGQKVKAGQIIGYAGSTGRSTGVHLHYEIHRYGKLVNPLRMLYLNSRNRI
ncbi:M23/M37 peptidase domain protein [Hydrogenivirga sp. 128-5-R1-1]|nr:M23/M37 peptidase domain protein [Hydrogenivirga sp. 128-5-R1-1]